MGIVVGAFSFAVKGGLRPRQRLRELRSRRRVAAGVQATWSVPVCVSCVSDFAGWSEAQLPGGWGTAVKLARADGRQTEWHSGRRPIFG